MYNIIYSPSTGSDVVSCNDKSCSYTPFHSPQVEVLKGAKSCGDFCFLVLSLLLSI